MASATRVTKIVVGPHAVETTWPQRAEGYVAIRTPPEWGQRTPDGAFMVHVSPTCTLTIAVGPQLTSAASPIRQLNKTINPRNGGTIISGKTSSAHGVWGAQIYGPATQFQLLGTSVVKLARRRMAQLIVEVTAAPTCQPGDKTEASYGAVEHMLRTVRFHLRLKSKS